jgi:hypothetical protein
MKWIDECDDAYIYRWRLFEGEREREKENENCCVTLMNTKRLTSIESNQLYID